MRGQIQASYLHTVTENPTTHWNAKRMETLRIVTGKTRHTGILT
jgi:hypothetical protein